MKFHLNSFFEGDPAVEQATADPDQPEAVHEEVSKVSEECPTATTPNESVVVSEVMDSAITAKAGAITEEVVDVNSSEVSATEAVASQDPAGVEVAEEKEPLPKGELLEGAFVEQAGAELGLTDYWLRCLFN